MRRIFVKLSLMKTQMDRLYRFIKRILLFATPENKKLTDHIHAGYLSCVRDSARIAMEQELEFKKSFLDCEFFALALDTALFGQEHVLSCIARFTFPDRITQTPLFYSVCEASTGEDLANFVFDRLRNENVPFEKLTCLATDGAACMTGKRNGMISLFRSLISAHHGVQHCHIGSIWCFSHRLNLVIRDFQHVGSIKSIFHFVIGFVREGRLSVIGRGSNNSIIKRNSEKYRSHHRQDGLSIMMSSKL